MITGQVLGSVWATRKVEALSGMKLMLVECPDSIDTSRLTTFVAVDFVGAGIGDSVVIAKGSSARKAIAMPDAPVDATIVGIIDEREER